MKGLRWSGGPPVEDLDLVPV